VFSLLRRVLPLAITCLGLLACSTSVDGDRTARNSDATTATSPPVIAPSLSPPRVGPEAWDRSDIPPDAVRIEVGDDAQRLVDANPPRTAFLFASGVHSDVSIRRPKHGNGFYGEVGAILDGRGEVRFAIVAYDDDLVSDVVIRGLVVENYAPPTQLAALGGGSGIGWSIDFNEVRESSAAGIQLGDASAARQNYVHHNRQIGIKTGNPTEGVVISENEVSFNNYEDEYEYAFEAGGMKIVNSVDVTIEANYVHNNHGPGIWTDINNVGARILRNIARDNYGPGIFHEISYSALISENLVTGNGFRFYTGGILVASSSGVEISGNAVLDNDGGIVAIQEDRGGGRLGEFLLDTLVVRRNLVSYSEGFTGVLDQVGGGDIFRRSITFSANTYMVSSVSRPFAWGGRYLTPTQWLSVHPSDQ
jgi:hypothetical protein